MHSGAYALGPDYALYFAAPAGLINLWALIELGFLRGSLGPNRFGDNPTGIEVPPPLPAGTTGLYRFSPGAAAWIASACTPPASSFASAALIMRWRSIRLFPRKASDTI